MSSEDPDREIARLFDEQRRADEASAPALRELLARPNSRQTSWKRGIGRIALATAAAAAATAGVLLLRPAHHRDGGRVTELPPAASQLASWKAPTDALLRTPGSELWNRVPILVSRSSPLVDPAHPAQTTKGVGE
jgi:hypothetical protein